MSGYSEDHKSIDNSSTPLSKRSTADCNDNHRADGLLECVTVSSWRSWMALWY